MRVWERKILHGNQSFLSSIPPRSSCSALLSVGREVKGNEEQQIRTKDSHASECGKLFSCTGTVVWRPGEIAVGEVGVGSEVDEEQVDDELDDLKHGDVFLPPDADTTGSLEIIPKPRQSSSTNCSIFGTHQYMTTWTVKFNVIGTQETAVLPTSCV